MQAGGEEEGEQVKRVREILIRVTLEDGRRAEVVWVRQEKIAEILHSDDLGPTIRDMVESVGPKERGK